MVHMGSKRRHVLKSYVTAILMVALVITLIPTRTGVVSDPVLVLAAEKAWLNESKLSLKVGEKFNLFVDGLEIGDKVTYKTSKKKVATVAATGVVTAKKKGSTEITATVKHSNGKTDSYKCKVAVVNPKKQGGIKFTEISGKQEFLDAVSTGKDGVYKLSMGMVGINNSIPIASDVTIDLNGQMVRGSTEYGLFQVVGGGSLTIMDSSGSNAFMFNSGKGRVVDCIDGTVTIESGMLMSDGEGVVYSEDDLVINGGSLSGGSKCAVYVADGEALINGGYITSSPKGIQQIGGEVVINDVEIESSADCLFSQGGTMEVCGGKFTAGDRKTGRSAAITGGTLSINDGSFSYGLIGVILAEGQLFVNGGEIVPLYDGESNGIYAANPKGDTEITINGGSIKAGHAGVYLENVEKGSIVINGGNIKSTGPVGITAKDCAITISGGKVECENTVVSINNSIEDKKSTVKGGTFTGELGLVVNGKADVKIDAGTFKSGEFGLVITAGYDGNIKYTKDVVGKVLDQRKGGEKNSDSDPSGYRRIDVKYKEGMTITDVSTLYSVICLAAEQLIPYLEFKTTMDLAQILVDKEKQYLLQWRHPIEGYYETTTHNLSYRTFSNDSFVTVYITFTIGKEHQITVLAADKSYYNKVDKDVREYSDMIDEILDSIINKKMTDEEKVIAVHDYMCENYQYADPIVETGSKSDHTFHAMLDDGTGVCQAYASLFNVMMIKLGIKSECVPGESFNQLLGGKREKHMWNRVMIDDTWLYVDVTWDDGGAGDFYLLKTEKEFYSDGKHFPEN